jgi:hypothetical protein
MLKLFFEIVDPEVVAELSKWAEGPERDSYAASALRLGVLALRQARGELDAHTIRQEGERLLGQVKMALAEHANGVTSDIAGALRQYLDPSTGALPQRLERLIKSDGELDHLLARHLGDHGSLARTLAEHVGEQSVLMRRLSPGDAAGFLRELEDAIGVVLEGQRQGVLDEFSLDRPESALSRLVRTITDNQGRLREDFERNVDSLSHHFSLDHPDSALSRLVKQVDAAQQGITQQFSLDDPGSSLSRLQRELTGLMQRLVADQQQFQSEVKVALATLQARKQEAARSTRHGGEFEDAVCEVLGREIARLGDIAKRCGTIPGTIRNNKFGDLVAELGPDSAAPRERIVVEAKAAGGYDVSKALKELDEARKNREAHAGLFVFARGYAPTNLEPVARYGHDVLTIWDPEDPTTDLYLKAAYSVARALVVAQGRAGAEVEADFSEIDAALTEIGRGAEGLEDVCAATKTITNANEKIAVRARAIREALLKEVLRLEEHLRALRRRRGEKGSWNGA